MANRKYCNSLTQYSRFQTREVRVGNIGIGGSNPIRVQSMTTTDTMDTEATVLQSIRMIDAGCELVRITAPSRKDAENLAHIKARLREKGYDTPICADIHFTPNAAEIAARIVEKVRVNPGNYADKKKFENIEYNDESYKDELARIRERFIPLVEICKEYRTAMRIGTNHGSLSDRILSRYGDTPLGMVESAMEFLRICEDLGFHNIVLSMKASNTQVMVQAYRLLVSTMIENNMDYPLHLGVTEAGEGEDGRIKSAVGIGALMEDGLGDTIRVSLTEDPEFEIPVAKALVGRYANRSETQDSIPDYSKSSIDPFQFRKRPSTGVHNIGGESVPRVIGDLSQKESISPANLYAFGYNYSVELDKWNLTDQACDLLFVGAKQLDFQIPGTLGIIQEFTSWQFDKERHYPIFNTEQYCNSNEKSSSLNFVSACLSELTEEFVKLIKTEGKTVLVLWTKNTHAMPELRGAFSLLNDKELDIPVVIQREYDLSENDFQLHAATDIGGLLIDGLSDGCWLTSTSVVPNKVINSTAFGILQAARARISKTEYISCPSCGRTLFDLQETTAKIRNRTDHLKGVKIGIMGCIVNGPGEMADADYGYVGTGKGKVTLYKGQEVVMRNVDSENALKELENLIKEHGDWVERLTIEE